MNTKNKEAIFMTTKKRSQVGLYEEQYSNLECLATRINTKWLVNRIALESTSVSTVIMSFLYDRDKSDAYLW